MAASSDHPLDPETGRVIDPEVLAERRARRIERADEGLLERAERAERMVVALEHRLDEAEGRLAIAKRERGTLATDLERTERDLTAALQREFAEQRLRVELEGDTGGAVARLEEEATELRAAHRAADERAAELAVALGAARAEVDAARARAAAERQAVAADPTRDGLRSERELQALAEELHGSLLGERAAREQAERALATERERAAAEVVLLQHELERRASVHAAVRAQIGELRSAFDEVRARSGAAVEDREAALADAVAGQDELREALAVLEADQRRSAARLSEGRAELALREGELRAAEDRLRVREDELRALREEADGHREARREAEAAAASVGARTAELEGTLEDERRQRLALETLLEAERARFAAEITGSEQVVRAALEQQRTASEARLAEVQRTVEGLRAELAAAAAELDRRLASEQAAREAVERELAAEREARITDAGARAADVDQLTARLGAAEAALAEAQGFAAGERERLVAVDGTRDADAEALARARAQGAAAEQARAALEAELAERIRLEDDVRGALGALRGELDAERRGNATRAEREAAVELLVAELVVTADELRQGFERAVERLAVERDAQLAAEREAFAAELGEMEGRVAALREQLTAAAEQLREQLEEEQTARWVAEAELAREIAGRTAAEARAAQALDALSAELERGSEAGNPIYGTLSAGLFTSTTDHPALQRPEPAPAAAPTPVVDDLARAAERLRASAPEPVEPAPASVGEPVEPAPEPVEPAPASVPEAVDPAPEPVELAPATVDPEPEPEPVGPEPEPAGPPRFAPEAEVEAAPAPPAPALADLLPKPPVRTPDPAPVAPPTTTLARAAAATPRPAAPTGPWFAEALVALAALDAASAERVLLAALETQANVVERDVSYEIELPATGRHHVRVGRRGRAVVTPVGEAPTDAEFRLEGTVETLAPLVAGGGPRRLRGVTVRGRKRRLRRLMKALSAPVGLAELGAVGARPRPGDLLALLCLGVPSAAVRGRDFGVAYVVVGDDGDVSRTLVRAEPDGSLTAIPDAPVQFPADATVSVDAGGLLGVLGGTQVATATGDAEAVAALHAWLRGAQSLPA